MIKNSKISWTGPTWNWIQGCTKKTIDIDGQTRLREECRNCYMYRDKKRYGQKPQIVVRSKPPTFNKPLKLQREVEQGKRPDFIDRLVFTCSWSDFFNPEADEWRPEAWEIIRQCPDLIFQILTKLPERIGDHLPPFWNEIKGRIWMGYSCGMPGAEMLIEDLIQCDSAVRFLSCEPLLGFLNLTDWLDRLDWVIVGGESGPNSRPIDTIALNDLLAQCRHYRVPVFIKQMGTIWARDAGASQRTGEDMDEWPENLRVRMFPGDTYDFEYIETEGPDFYIFYWECPECDRVVHISRDRCECEQGSPAPAWQPGALNPSRD